MKEKVIRVSDEMYAEISAYAKQRSIGVYEAAERMLRTAVGRRAAVRKYADNSVSAT